MAQKREKEETELKVPETVNLCAPPIPTPPKLSGNDDSTSSSARTPESSDLAKISIIDENPKAFGVVDHRSSSETSIGIENPRVAGVGDPRSTVRLDRSREMEKRPERREVFRCSGCRRKVGLTGFRCRCGELFCSEHRYSDRHDCSFDYKAAGREAIARENPVVRAAKILKV